MAAAKAKGCQGVSFTYNEPTVSFEYVYDVAKAAKKAGLFTTMVTNGYLTPEAVKIVLLHFWMLLPWMLRVALVKTFISRSVKYQM